MTEDEDKLIHIVDTWFQISGTLKEYVIVLYGLYIWFLPYTGIHVPRCVLSSL